MGILGRICRLQVQTSSLKVDAPDLGASQRVYSPEPICEVSRLIISTRGAVGVTSGNEALLDVHNADHPTSRNIDGTNALSVGFTPHYEAMRRRFGDHIADGIAGENILVETTSVVTIEMLRAGAVIRAHDGKLINLAGFVVAEPCVEFALFAFSAASFLPPIGRVTRALRFLRGGRRGFYATYGGPDVEVRTGDRVTTLVFESTA